MVFVKDSADDDSQGRQLVVNKRLSKAISAVPRARFQRARPNVPNSKRTESNSSQPKIQKPSINSEDTKNNSQLSHDSVKTSDRTQKPINEETHKSSLHTVRDETSADRTPKSVNVDSKGTCCQSSDSEKSSDSVQTSVHASNTESEIQISPNQPFDRLQKPCVDNDKEIQKETDSRNSSENSCSNSEDAVVLNTETLTDPSHLQLCIDFCGVTSVSGASSTIYNAVKNSNLSYTSKEAEASIFTHETNARKKEVYEYCVQGKESLSEPCTITPEELEEVDEVHSKHPQSESHKGLNGSSKNSALEVPVPVTPVVSDRASKYPQLTSILSKKRAEPKKDVQQKRRRKYKKGDVAPERSKMTMADLIYWNPTNTDQGMKKTPVPEVELTSTDADEPSEEPLVEEEELPTEESSVCDSVPRLVLSEDGTVTIDQVSLVVSRKRLPDPPINEVVRNEETTYSSFRKRPLSKQWSSKDTCVFYKALSLVGTDFGLMEKLLPNRTRRELKMKFKREEKYNIDLINRAMYDSHLTFDAKTLEEEIQSLNSVGIDVDINSSEDKLPSANGNKSKKRKQISVKKAGNENEINVSVDAAGSQVLEPKKVSKRKKDKELSETSINIDHSEESTLEENSKGLKTNKIGRKRKKKNDLSEDEADKNDSVTQVENERNENKRMRKKKTFPDCYIDIDDVDFDINVETRNGTSRPTSPDEDSMDNQPSSPNEELREVCDNPTNIEILLVEGPEAEVPTTLMCNQTTVVMDKASVENLPNVIQQLVQHNVASQEPQTRKNCRENAPHKFKKKASLTTGNLEEQDLTNQNISENECNLIENTENEIHVDSSALSGKTVLVRNVSTNEVSLPIDVSYPESDKSAPVTINLDCVMANEIVTSVEPPKKVRKKTNTSKKPKLPRILPSTKIFSNPVQPSFLNYTPTELDQISETDVKFSPKSNMRTYLKSPVKTPKNIRTYLKSPMKTPKNRITSLQIPALTPENPSSLVTNLKKSNTIPFTIPVAPELNSMTNPVMLFAQSPSKDNVIHMFMYNEQNQ